MNPSNFVSSLRPSREHLVDLAFAVTLSLIAISTFRSTFAGGEELIVGVPAILLGVVVGYVAARCLLDALVTAAVALLVFVLAAGAIAVPSEALLGFLPTFGVLQAAADGLVSGWVRLLTAVPPAGEAGNLLMVPYAVGYVGALGTVMAAVRWRTTPLVVLGPSAVLVTGILFGTRVPVSVLVHGVLFGAAVIGWASLRAGRSRSVVVGSEQRLLLVSRGATLAVIALAGAFLGPLLPGAETNPRYVLREHVDPPFDPLDEPSPLVGYRLYTGTEAEEAEVLRVHGLPAGVPLRLAVFDDYDGLVWRATGRGTALAGRFARVGERIPGTVDGEPVGVEVEVQQPHGSWVPTFGDVVSVDLGPTDRDEQLRFNLETETAAVSGGLQAGERYTVTGVVPSMPPEDELLGRPLARQYGTTEEDLPNALAEIAAQLRGGAASPYARVSAIATALREDGAFSDGGADAVVATPPGHSLSRIAGFLGAPQWVGNGEQYAAALGLLARAEGIPARVVMGFRPESIGGEEITVRGADIAAWVEIPLEGVGWVPVDGTPPEENLPDPTVQPQPRPRNPDPQPPPPPADPPPAVVPQDLAGAETDDADGGEEDLASGGIGTVVLAAGGVTLLGMLLVAGIVSYKLRRRARRRQQGSAQHRAVGGWEELLDGALDLGHPVPPRSTRLEASQSLGAVSATSVATAADTWTFGTAEPTDADLDRLWSEVDAVLGELRGRSTPIERARAHISLNSLRKERR